MRVTSEAIKKAARGESCTLRVPGVCNENPETVVACHSNFHEDGGGMGMKSEDIYVAFGCSDCHDYIDGRIGRPSKDELRDIFHRGMKRTWHRLIELGIITIKGFKP